MAVGKSLTLSPLTRERKRAIDTPAAGRGWNIFCKGAVDILVLTGLIVTVGGP